LAVNGATGVFGVFYAPLHGVLMMVFALAGKVIESAGVKRGRNKQE
jgi:hypothetical protein